MIKTSILTILILLAQAIFPQSAAAGGPCPDITVTPTSIDFGNVSVWTYSSPVTVTVTNNGNADLIIYGIDISGTDASQFFIASISTTYQIIPPGSSASGTVVLAPTSSGDKSARVRIYSNDPCHQWTYVYLKGKGIYNPSYQPDITVVPAAVNFGLIQMGTQSPPRTVTVTNNGNANLIVYSAGIDGTNASQFFIASAPATSGTLLPGESASGTVVFRPTSTGDKSAYIYIYSNDPDEPLVEVDLSGRGVDEPVVPDIAVTPMLIDFGEVPTGTSSIAENVTVTNEGIADLVIGNLTINNDRFTITSGNISLQALPPDTSANITLLFSPTAAGGQSANLTIPSNDPDENPVLVKLTGSGSPEAQPDIEVTPLSLDFGASIRVGQTGAQRLVTIRNAGDAALVIGTLTREGANPGDFIFFSDNASGKTLPPGTATLVYLRFAPTDTGLRTGTLRIPSNDPDENPVDVSLAGTGAGTPDMLVDPLFIDFGEVPVGSSSPDRTVTITNIGSADLSIDMIDTGGSDKWHFAITSDDASGGTLGPGDSATVSVRFSPTTEGDKFAYLAIAAYAPDYGFTYVDLYGKATGVLQPRLQVEPDEINFGQVTVGSSSPPQTVIITNTGGADLSIDSVILAGYNPGDFDIIDDHASGQSVPPGDSANFSVQFNPGSEGPKWDRVYIFSNDPDYSYLPFTVYLSGNGETVPLPDITIEPPLIDFGPIAVGDSSYSEMVTITNDGDADLAIGPADIVGGDAANFVITGDDASDQTLAPGEFALIYVNFSPATPGYKSAGLRIISNDPDEHTVTVFLVGTGIGPDIAVEPTSVNFGYVLTDTTTAPGVVTVTNEGTDDLITGTISLTGPDFSEFMIASDNVSAKTLAPGDSANISVTFTPISTGAKSAFLSIPSNDPDENPFDVTLSGTGTEGPLEPDISVEPMTIDFGRVKRGTTSRTENIKVTNHGTAELDIGTITLNNPRFTITSGNISGEKLAPGASVNISIVFKPTVTGAQTAVLSIPSNDPDESVVNVTLSGTGTRPPDPGPGPNPPEPTPTPTPSGETEPQRYFTVDFLGRITKELADSLGRPVKNMTAPSPDDAHLLEIEAGTGASDNAGLTVTLLEIREAPTPPLPENTRLIGQALEFKPSGAVFDKTIELTLGYNVNELPEGVISVGAAYYTTASGWVFLEPEPGGVAELGKVTAPVNHFTVFAVLAKVKAPEIVPPEGPTPEPGPPSEPAKIPALFRLGNLFINLSESKYFGNVTYITRTGEEAIITADITNDGEQPGTYTAILLLNGEERERKEITLQPGQTQAVSFTVTGNEPGRYDVVIGNLTGDFLSELWVNWWLFAGTAGALILLAWLVWYIIKRRIKQKVPT